MSSASTSFSKAKSATPLLVECVIRATQFLGRDIFVRHRLDHIQAGIEHIGNIPFTANMKSVMALNRPPRAHGPMIMLICGITPLKQRCAETPRHNPPATPHLLMRAPPES